MDKTQEQSGEGQNAQKQPDSSIRGQNQNQQDVQAQDASQTPNDKNDVKKAEKVYPRLEVPKTFSFDINQELFETEDDNSVFMQNISMNYGTTYTGYILGQERHGLGVLTWPDGGIECGTWKFNRLEGDYVSTMLDQGRVYVGGLYGYSREGHGKDSQPNGVTYTGGFKNNKRHGQCELIMADGDFYTGQFVDGKKSGNGKYTWVNETKSKQLEKIDQIVNIIQDKELAAHQAQKFSEMTRERSSNVAKYKAHFEKCYKDWCKPFGFDENKEGSNINTWYLDVVSDVEGYLKLVDEKMAEQISEEEFKDLYEKFDQISEEKDKIYLEDFKTYVDAYVTINSPAARTLQCKGDTYDGEWLEGDMHGFGTKTFAEGGSYEGNWDHDNFHGQGKRVYKSGAYYEGEWVQGKKEGQGTYKYAKGDLYVGQWANDRKEGKGKMDFGAGGSYDGDWLAGKKHGYGERSWDDGASFKGHWKEDKKNGKGKYIWADGSFYDGEYLDDQMDGDYGEYDFGDGGNYKGQWKANDFHGKGKRIWPDGDEYDGEWANDQQNGFGVYKYGNGGYYEGHWKDAKHHGQGKKVFAEGNVYEGGFQNGLKHGQGKFSFTSGAYYEGPYQADLQHGWGCYKWPNGNIYFGDFDKKERTGRGTMIRTSGETYKGKFINGLKHGKGVQKWKDGQYYDGEWRDDRKHGYGIMVWPDGDTYAGTWQDGDRHGLAIFKDVAAQDGKERACFWKNDCRMYYFDEQKIEDKKELKVDEESDVEDLELDFNEMLNPDKKSSSKGKDTKDLTVENVTPDQLADFFSITLDDRKPVRTRKAKTVQITKCLDDIQDLPHSLLEMSNNTSWYALAQRQQKIIFQMQCLKMSIKTKEEGYHRSLLRRALDYIRLGAYDQAAEDANQFLALETEDNSEGVVLLACSMMGNKKVKEASEYLKKRNDELKDKKIQKVINQTYSCLQQMSDHEEINGQIDDWVKYWILANRRNFDEFTKDFCADYSHYVEENLEFLNQKTLVSLFGNPINDTQDLQYEIQEALYKAGIHKFIGDSKFEFSDLVHYLNENSKMHQELANKSLEVCDKIKVERALKIEETEHQARLINVKNATHMKDKTGDREEALKQMIDIITKKQKEVYNPEELRKFYQWHLDKWTTHFNEMYKFNKDAEGDAEDKTLDRAGFFRFWRLIESNHEKRHGKCIEWKDHELDTMYDYINKLNIDENGMSRDDRKHYLNAQRNYYRYENFLKDLIKSVLDKYSSNMKDEDIVQLNKKRLQSHITYSGSVMAAYQNVNKKEEPTIEYELFTDFWKEVNRINNKLCGTKIQVSQQDIEHDYDELNRITPGRRHEGVSVADLELYLDMYKTYLLEKLENAPIDKAKAKKKDVWRKSDPFNKIYKRRDRKVKIASYHFGDGKDVEIYNGFKEETDLDKMKVSTSYVCYENAPDDWTTDNGEKYPAKCYLKGLYFNQAERAMCGWIDWRDRTVADGQLSWQYKFVFSSDYTEIVSGYCIKRDDQGIRFKTESQRNLLYDSFALRAEYLDIFYKETAMRADRVLSKIMENPDKEELRKIDLLTEKNACLNKPHVLKYFQNIWFFNKDDALTITEQNFKEHEAEIKQELKRLQQFWRKLQARDMKLSKEILKVAEKTFYSNHQEILENSKNNDQSQFIKIANGETQVLEKKRNEVFNPLLAIADTWNFAGDFKKMDYHFGYKDLKGQSWLDLAIKESDLEKKVQFLSQSIKYDPTSFESYELRCKLFMQFGKYTMALRDANRMLELQPNFWMGYYFKAQCLCGMEQVDMALDFINERIDEENNRAIQIKFTKLLQKIKARRQEIQEQSKTRIVPQWYINWILCNIDEERPVQYVLFAEKAQRTLNKITTDPVAFCLSDPETNMRKLIDIIGDNLRAYQHLKSIDNKPEKSSIVRHNIIGAPGQGNQATYSEYSKYILEAKTQSVHETLARGLGNLMKEKAEVAKKEKEVTDKMNESLKKMMTQKDELKRQQTILKEKFDMEKEEREGKGEDVKDEMYETLTNKNKATQLDGVLTDSLSVYQYAKFQNIIQKDKIHLVSQHMQVSNDLTPTKIKKILAAEIKFYDLKYFEVRNNPQIEIYYSGHGEENCLKLSEDYIMKYDSHIIDHMASKINEHTKSLKLEKQINWFVNMYVDACHSGSALDAGKKWIISKGGEMNYWKDKDTYKDAEMDYFDCWCTLEMQIWASAAADETANDAGQGRGGKWTNHFIAKGKKPNPSFDGDHGKVLYGYRGDGTLVKQTTCLFRMELFQKPPQQSEIEKQAIKEYMTVKEKPVEENLEVTELKDDPSFVLETFAPKFRINKNKMESKNWKVATAEQFKSISEILKNTELKVDIRVAYKGGLFTKRKDKEELEIVETDKLEDYKDYHYWLYREVDEDTPVEVKDEAKKEEQKPEENKEEAKK